jgi:hypothetical protein
MISGLKKLTRMELLPNGIFDLAADLGELAAWYDVAQPVCDSKLIVGR